MLGDEGDKNEERPEQLRSRIIAAQRRVLVELRAQGAIGDEAFHEVEARLDFAELNATGIVA